MEGFVVDMDNNVPLSLVFANVKYTVPALPLRMSFANEAR